MTAQQQHERVFRSRWLPVAAVLWLGSPPALAWDDFGHMTVAAVAWHHLSAPARRQACALLQLNPDYAGWVARVPAAHRNEVAFLKAATWPDAIKHEAGYVDDGERPDSPQANLNTGYADRSEHRDWHYVDVPFSPDGTALPPIPAPNAATRLVDFRRTLGDGAAAPSLRSYDLVWLLHLVGDLHQPLHAVSRYTRELPHGDRGGNLVRVCAPQCRQTLHGFWDDALGRGSAARALLLAAELPAPPPGEVADARVGEWVRESGRLARYAVYVAPIGRGEGPYDLPLHYRAKARLIARQRAALAGRRLAVLLNRALGRSPAPPGSPAGPPG